MSKFLVGDMVWSPVYKNGCIIDIEKTGKYPIKCRFSFNGPLISFSLKGIEERKDQTEKTYPTLFYYGSYVSQAPEPKRMCNPIVGNSYYVSGNGVDNQSELVKIVYVGSEIVVAQSNHTGKDNVYSLNDYTFCKV